MTEESLRPQLSRPGRRRRAALAAGILAALACTPAPFGAVAFATVPATSASAPEGGGGNGGEYRAAGPLPVPGVQEAPETNIPGPAAANGPVSANGPAAGSGPAAANGPAAGSGPAPAAPDPKATPGPAAPPGFGAYLDYGPRGIERMSGFARWLGGREPTVGHTYLPGDVWANIEGRPSFLADWARWRRAKPGRTLVLNVPMLDRNEAWSPDPLVARKLREGARGDYDEHFRALAGRLVSLGVPDTVLVLGWEMNGTTYAHRCGPDPKAWKRYWNRIVTAMRTVPGQKFRFDFTPARGKDAIGWTECYPGDDTVDIIGMDSYDQPKDMDFDRQVSEPYGLQDHVDFAKDHGKPVSYPEWGLFRNGDNPEYLRRMIAWMAAHPPLYQTLSDYCPHGVWRCGSNRAAAEVYRAAFTAGARTPGGQEAGGPAPGEDENAGCLPVDLGGWFQSRLGGRLCVRFSWLRD